MEEKQKFNFNFLENVVRDWAIVSEATRAKGNLKKRGKRHRKLPLWYWYFSQIHNLPSYKTGRGQQPLNGRAWGFAFNCPFSTFYAI